MKTIVPILLAAWCASAAAQEHAMPAAAPAPQALEQGIGVSHHKVSTENAEAQKYFDQGLSYFYGFNQDAAIRSFHRAAALDPELAMAWWGTALALGPNINLDVDPDREKQANDAVRTALVHAEKATPGERELIAALVKRYSADPKADLHQLAVDYSQAMAAVTKKYPDDLDAATLYAESLMDLHPWKLWTHDGRPGEDTETIVAVLQSVVARDPNHLGANHFLIHALEASPHPERALASADRFRTLAPAAGHLVHMPAHIYQRLGNYAGAALANEQGVSVDRAYIKQWGLDGLYPTMYYNHNLDFGSASYSMEGRFADAKRMADEVGVNALAAVKEMPMLDPAVPAPLVVLLRFGRWKEILEVKDPGVGAFSSGYRHFARGTAFAKLGDADAAQREKAALDASMAAIAAGPVVILNDPKVVADIAAMLLEGRIHEARGERAEAIASFRKAVAIEDSLNYDEPSDWRLPSREALGACLLADGQHAEAEKVFRDDLAINLRNPHSLFGLAAALDKQKKSEEAAKVRHDLTEATKSADSEIRLSDL